MISILNNFVFQDQLNILPSFRELYPLNDLFGGLLFNISRTFFCHIINQVFTEVMPSLSFVSVCTFLVLFKVTLVLVLLSLVSKSLASGILLTNSAFLVLKPVYPINSLVSGILYSIFVAFVLRPVEAAKQASYFQSLYFCVVISLLDHPVVLGMFLSISSVFFSRSCSSKYTVF